MTTRPTLALLIPAYNAAEFLPRLLRSAHAQTAPFDAIWVYDDCSTDDTAAVAEQFGAKVIRGSVNRGCSAGKNALAQSVDAGWLHFHDADDELMPNFVALAQKWIAQSEHDIVLFDYEYRDEVSGELLLVRRFDHHQLTLDAPSYAIREQINPFCGLYRRSAYLAAGGYDEDPEILYNEDVAFHIRMAFAGLTFGAENEISIINYRRGGSMSGANQLKCLKAHFAVMQRALARPEAAPYQTDIAAKLWGVAGRLAAFGDWASADAAAQLARKICLPDATAGSRAFRLFASVNPRLALRMREYWIRQAKPELREADTASSSSR